MKKFAIFDLDGTLLDTIDDLFLAINEMLVTCGYPEISREKIRTCIGHGARVFVQKAIEPIPADDAEADRCLEIYRQIYDRDGTSHARVFAGMKEALAELKARGVRLAVYSNKPDFATRHAIAQYFGDTFEIVYGAREGIPVKPDPAGALAILDEWGADPADAAFVGDGDTDFLTAKAAGMKPVSVLWGYRTREELSACGATVFAETPEQMKNFILED